MTSFGNKLFTICSSQRNPSACPINSKHEVVNNLVAKSRSLPPRKDAIGITTYIKDGLCKGVTNFALHGPEKRPRKPPSAAQDPILFGIKIDNAFARRINRGMVPPNGVVFDRVREIIARCSELDVHLIAAQVKMPEQTFDQSGEQVILRTELDAIGYMRPRSAGEKGTIVVVELKTSVTPNGYSGGNFFTQAGSNTARVAGFRNTLFCRHIVQVLFGMHCVDAFRVQFNLDQSDNIAGLLLYSQGSGCVAKWVRHPALGPPRPYVDLMWHHRLRLFSQTRRNPQQKPLASASDRVKQNFLTTTWWKTHVAKWPTGERANSLQKALFRDSRLRGFSQRANAAEYVPEDTNFPCVSAVFRHRTRPTINLYVCIVTNKFDGTKKRTRLNQLYDSINANQGSVFAVLIQTMSNTTRRIGWKAVEKKVI